MIERTAVQRVLFFLAMYYLAVGFALLLPSLASVSNLFTDGRRIMRSTPSLSDQASSFEVARYVLSPLINLAQALGIDMAGYGYAYDADLYLANWVAGSVVFLLVLPVMLAYQLPPRMDRGAALALAPVVLLSPYIFVLSKEVIPLAACALLMILGRWQRWPPWMVGATFAVALIVLSEYFRSYYLLIGLLVLISLAAARSGRLLAMMYVAYFVYLFVGYSTLPLDDIRIGRSEYLADVSGSRIFYPFDDTGALKFALNRAYTFVAMMVPIQLPLRSVSYTPFALLQLVITYRIVQAVWQGRDELTRVAAHVLLAYSAVSALFEPDYGSYFRHKVGAMIFMLIILSRTRPSGDEEDLLQAEGLDPTTAPGDRAGRRTSQILPRRPRPRSRFAPRRPEVRGSRERYSP